MGRPIPPLHGLALPQEFAWRQLPLSGAVRAAVQARACVEPHPGRVPWGGAGWAVAGRRPARRGQFFKIGENTASASSSIANVASNERRSRRRIASSRLARGDSRPSADVLWARPSDLSPLSWACCTGCCRSSALPPPPFLPGMHRRRKLRDDLGLRASRRRPAIVSPWCTAPRWISALPVTRGPAPSRRSSGRDLPCPCAGLPLTSSGVCPPFRRPLYGRGCARDISSWSPTWVPVRNIVCGGSSRTLLALRLTFDTRNGRTCSSRCTTT